MKYPLHQMNVEHRFLSNAGELGTLIYSKDWSDNPVGDRKNWPQSLLTTLGIILHSKFPMFLFWGEDLICFYNDAFRPSLGNEGKHPHILGMKGKDAWPEIWHVIKPLIDQVLYNGTAVWLENELVPFYRNGQIENIYWTFSYSPVIGESGKAEGVFVTCIETTNNVNNITRLNEQEAFYRNLLDAAPMATAFLAGENFNIELANEEVLRMWNKDRNIIGKPLLEALPEINGQPHLEELKKVFSTGQPYYGKEELRNQYINGEVNPVYLDIIYKAIYDNVGNIRGVMGMANNVTQQVSTRKQASESEERSRLAIEAAMLGTFDIDIKTCEKSYSQRFKEILGFATTELTYQQIIETFHPDDWAIWERANMHAIEKGAIDFEIRIIWPDKSIHWINPKGKLFFDEAGNPVRILGTVRDITTEKNLFVKLEESEKKFRNTVMQAPVGILILRGTELVVEMANKTYLQIVDRKEEDFIGKSLFETLPEVRAAVYPLMKNVMETGIPYEGIEFPVTLNRYGKEETTYFNFVYQPLVEEDGRITGLIVVANEVTKQVTAKHAVEENERKVREMVTISPIAMAIFRGKDFVIEVANQALLKNLWRRQLHEVEGRKLIDVFPELKNQRFPELLNHVFNTGVTHTESEAEAYVDASDGRKHFFLDFEYAPLFEKNGSVSGVMITVNDVSEKVEARKLLKDTAERLQLAVEGSKLATWDLNLQTGEMFHTSRLAEIFGYDNDVQVQYPQMLAQVHPDDRQNIVEKAFNLAMETGDYFYEARIVLSNKSLRWIRTQGKVIFNGLHEPLRMLGTLMDITTQKYAEQQKDDFIKIASHELKTPVTSIKGYVQLLQKMNENGDEFLTQSLSVINKQVAKLTKLITDLLDVTRIEIGGLLLHKEHFNLTDLVNEIKRDVEATTHTHEIVITLENKPVIYADHDRIAQVLINLFTNAIKYSPDSNKVLVNVNATSSEVNISVQDFGIGIDKNEHHKIFERFYRAGGMHEKTFPGFGIGLFIVNEIVTLHNGKVWVESEKGKGSIFFVTLPVNG